MRLPRCDVSGKISFHPFPAARLCREGVRGGRGPLGRGEVIEGEFMCHQDELGWPGRYLSIIPQSIKHQSIQETSKKTLPGSVNMT